MTRLAPLVALLATACAPAMLQTARTNGQGNFQFAVEPGVGAGLSGGIGGVWPELNLSGRYGVSDRIDLGLRIGTSLYEFQTKFMLTDPTATDGVALALAPSTTIIGGGGGGVGAVYWNTRVPLLIGIPAGTSELTIGPRLTPTVVAGGGGGVGAGGFVLSGGASLGYAAHVGTKFRVMPEVGLDVPFVGAVAAGGGGTGTSAAGVGTGVVLFNAAVGFLIGGPDE
jgi:hypothetical protein